MVPLYIPTSMELLCTTKTDQNTDDRLASATLHSHKRGVAPSAIGNDMHRDFDRYREGGLLTALVQMMNGRIFPTQANSCHPLAQRDAQTSQARLSAHGQVYPSSNCNVPHPHDPWGTTSWLMIGTVGPTRSSHLWPCMIAWQNRTVYIAVVLPVMFTE